MRDVLKKAQELGEAILNSDVYKRRLQAEEAVTADPDAAALVAAYLEKRSEVEALLGNADMDPADLARAGEELQKRQDEMEACGVVREVRAANETYNTMMDNVNRLLRLIVDGDSGDESGACTGSCDTCPGCH